MHRDDEVTEAMVEAARAAFAMRLHALSDDHIRAIYLAMRRASPQPAEVSAGVAIERAQREGWQAALLQVRAVGGQLAAGIVERRKVTLCSHCAATMPCFVGEEEPMCAECRRDFLPAEKGEVEHPAVTALRSYIRGDNGCDEAVCADPTSGNCGCEAELIAALKDSSHDSRGDEK